MARLVANRKWKVFPLLASRRQLLHLVAGGTEGSLMAARIADGFGPEACALAAVDHHPVSRVGHLHLVAAEAVLRLVAVPAEGALLDPRLLVGARPALRVRHLYLMAIKAVFLLMALETDIRVGTRLLFVPADPVFRVRHARPVAVSAEAILMANLTGTRILPTRLPMLRHPVLPVGIDPGVT